jgi:hypothetical protein
VQTCRLSSSMPTKMARGGALAWHGQQAQRVHLGVVVQLQRTALFSCSARHRCSSLAVAAGAAHLLQASTAAGEHCGA